VRALPRDRVVIAMIPRASLPETGRPPSFTGNVDDRANESHPFRAVQHGASSSFHWGASVSCAPQIATTAITWRAVDHVGCFPRIGGRGSRPVWPPATQGESRRTVAANGRGRPATAHAVADTHGLMPPYTFGMAWPFVCALLPNAGVLRARGRLGCRLVRRT
jgi:hypothetical protein